MKLNLYDNLLTKKNILHFTFRFFSKLMFSKLNYKIWYFKKNIRVTILVLLKKNIKNWV